MRELPPSPVPGLATQVIVIEDRVRGKSPRTRERCVVADDHNRGRSVSDREISRLGPISGAIRWILAGPHSALIRSRSPVPNFPAPVIMGAGQLLINPMTESHWIRFRPALTQEVRPNAQVYPPARRATIGEADSMSLLERTK